MTINQKQKILLPTLKERQRYLVYRIKFTDNNPIVRINEHILNECNALLGVFDAGKAGLMNVKYDEKTNKGIFRVENTYVDKLKVCLGMITKIQDKKINIDTIYVSGILNKAEEMIK